MRTIDRVAGVPLCWLSALWRMSVRKRQNAPVESVRTILILKFFGMGSILLSTPLLTRLYEQFPHARVFYLSFDANSTLLKRLPYPLTVLSIRTDSIVHFIGDTFLALKTLRRQHIDMAFDLEFFSKFSTLLSAFSGATNNVGYALPTFWRRRNITHAVPLDRTSHVAQVFLNQLSVVGVVTGTVPPLALLQATTSETISMERKLGLSSNGVNCYVVNINAGPTAPERRWPPGGFIETARHIAATDSAARLFFIGMREEQAYVGLALSGAPDLRERATNCAGLLSLGELIALLQRSRFIVTNDSGPMHLAAAAGTRAVALFGPESPQFYGPLGDARVVYKGIACSPCLNMYNAKLFVCPYNARCMKEIAVGDVIGALYPIEHQPQPRHVATTHHAQ